MESWPFLPEAPLDAAGPDSEAFLQHRLRARIARRPISPRASLRSQLRSRGLPAGPLRAPRHVQHEARAARGGRARAEAPRLAHDRDLRHDGGEYAGRRERSLGARAGEPSRGALLSALRRSSRRHHALGCRPRRRRSSASIQEWTIEPAQIGAHKVALHQQHLRDWLRERPALGFSFEEIWQIREACIRALGAS